MDWQDEYNRKLLSPEEAAKLIKSGDVIMAMGGSTDQPKIMQQAIFARGDELENVYVLHGCPMTDPGWLQSDLGGPFEVDATGYIGPIGRAAVNDKKTGFIPVSWAFTFKHYERAGEHRPIDWDIMTLSPPNRHGFCSLGHALWFKKDVMKLSKKIIAEVDANQRWFYGDTTVHVSEVDHFVEYTPPIVPDEELPQALAGVEPEEKRKKIEEYTKHLLPNMRPNVLGIFMLMDIPSIDSLAETLGILPCDGADAIAGYVNTLINDRDCFQIGQGSPSAFLHRFGAFAGKEDLGYHAEMTARGVGTMISEGQITGKYKTFMPGKSVFSSLDGLSPDELVYASENPRVELYSTGWVTAIPVVCRNDNMVSLQNGISVDLSGQINSESIFGGIMLNGPGGQPDSHIGALYSKGGRAITVMRATAVSGTVSCIVPQMEPGTVVTVPREYADYIVTEFGVAKLMGKSLRERANELISVAHPDFRAELKKEAERLFWP
ncbi:MAG: acetyl-CoA hydrolase/transferase C-terminal domain-containing protein [Chloroflexota bacterium]|nr:acetyl-CoA hydrolase/transferase C-terminal domain-containing protein [Chloroflexota bacterium]